MYMYLLSAFFPQKIFCCSVTLKLNNINRRFLLNKWCHVSHKHALNKRTLEE